MLGDNSFDIDPSSAPGVSAAGSDADTVVNDAEDISSLADPLQLDDENFWEDSNLNEEDISTLQTLVADRPGEMDDENGLAQIGDEEENSNDEDEMGDEEGFEEEEEEEERFRDPNAPPGGGSSNSIRV